MVISFILKRIVYTAFSRQNRGTQWCNARFLDYKSLSRAFAIRMHLKRSLKRFGIDIQSSGRDTVTIRKCLVAGFFSNAARLHYDGSYRSLRGNAVLHIHPNSVLAKRSPEFVIYNEGTTCILMN
jgi:ATP-dependent RNA helicase DDX35